ncbi:hypothetical protein PO909_002748 [Leuciscus waleckii]
MGPGRGQTSVLNDEHRANPSTPPAYEFQLLVYVQQSVKRKAQWRRAEVGGTNQLNKRPRCWELVPSVWKIKGMKSSKISALPQKTSTALTCLSGLI